MNRDIRKNRMLDDEMMHHEELIASAPKGTFLIGMGIDLISRIDGDPTVFVEDAVKELLRAGNGDGISRCSYRCKDGREVIYYTQRDGKLIEIGTREDLSDIGLGDLIDMLEKEYPNGSSTEIEYPNDPSPT